MPSIVDLKALAFLLAALTLGAIFRPRVKDDPISGRIVVYWFVAAVILIGGAKLLWLRFLLLTVAAIALMPKEQEYRPAFYLAALLAVISRMAYHVPFPGINYLILLDNAMLVALFVGIPTIIGYWAISKKDDRPKTPWLDFLVIGLFVLTSILLIRVPGTTPTHALRVSITQFLIIVVPYLAMSRGLINWKAIRAFQLSMLTNGVMMASAGFICWYLNWNIYFRAATFLEHMTALYRTGSLRLGITTEPTVVGILMAAFLFSVWHFRKQFITPKLYTWVWLGLGIFILIMTQARGGYLAAMVASLSLLTIRIRSIGTRTTVIVGLLILAVGGYAVLSSVGFDTIDPYGTFDYRRRLLAASMSEIKAFPFFGNPVYFLSPNFAEMIQGQGIVDFVNTYVQYALKYGLVGLFLYMLVFAHTGLSLLRNADKLRAAGQLNANGQEATGYGTAALLVGMLAMIGTISTVSYIEPMLSILVGVGAGYSRLARLTLAEQSKAAAEEIATDDAKEPATIKPPKKHFEIDVAPGPRGWPG